MKSLRFVFGLALCFVLLSACFGADELATNTRVNYLALGDSVTFGFIVDAGFQYVNPTNFIGYPDYVGQGLRLAPVDPACPGETTSSFLSPNGADNGCREFRATFPLHVPYSSTQLNFALGFLRAFPRTRLVTIGLGANDLFRLQNTCGFDPQCIQAGFPQALNTIATNMATILASLRATGYRGTILVVNYYSLDYSDPLVTAEIRGLNQALATAAASQHVPVVDVFSAFQAAATLAGGQTCKAGLLNASPQNQLVCDVHPSQSGQRLIALAVLKALANSSRE